MNLQKALLIFISLFIIFATSVSKKKDSNSERFEASNEWKEIKEGQKVPAGLHYRINLSNGKKEAKLIDNKEPDKSTSFSMVEESKEKENSKSTADLKENLQNIYKKNPKDKSTKFRTLEEIKKELGDIELQPKTDFEILQGLFETFEKESNKLKMKQPADNVNIEVLQELKNLGHQIDNGLEFIKMDGFKKIIYTNLNSTNKVVKQETLKLFSILAQNNPQVKIHILETGGITTLLRILSLDENLHVKNSAITALSCTLRTFPYAQNKFVEFGGLTIFNELFKSGSIKLKLKLFILLNDLITERQKDAANFKNHEFVDLEEAFYNLSWCDQLNELLHDLVKIDVNDHDSIEKCLLAMKSMMNTCGAFYNKDLILKLNRQYKILDQNDDNDTAEYFKYLSNLTEDISKSTSSYSKTSTKEDL